MRHIETKPSEPTFVIELTLAEAEALGAMARHIGGPPRGPRGAVEDVFAQLRELVRATEMEHFTPEQLRVKSGYSIYFG